MKVSRLRWWWLQARRIVLIPTEALIAGGCVKLTASPCVPVAKGHLPLRASFHQVQDAPAIGIAQLRGVGRDGWARYKVSVPLRGLPASGDWRARGKGIELAAIVLKPDAWSGQGLIAGPR